MNQLVELIKYGFFGGITTLINLALFFLFTQMGMQYIIANTISYIIAVIINYFLNQFFVFKTTGKPTAKKRTEFINFFLVRLGSLCVDNVLFFIVVDVFNINLYFGRITLSLLIIMLTFIVNKKFVFKKS